MKRLGLSLVALALAACSGGAESNDARMISMTEAQRFDPGSLTIPAGTTVAFSNESSQAHTVTAYEDGIPEGAEYFASGGFEDEDAARDDLTQSIVGQDGGYDVTFDVPGTYEYFCIPHEEQGMTGTIVVEE